MAVKLQNILMTKFKNQISKPFLLTNVESAVVAVFFLNELPASLPTSRTHYIKAIFGSCVAIFKGNNHEVGIELSFM